MNNNARNALVHHALEILKQSVLLELYEQPLDYIGRKQSLHQSYYSQTSQHTKANIHTKSFTLVA